MKLKRHLDISARKIQIALGCLWLVDGFLQLQPRMFTSDLANKVIAPAATGQPLYVASPIHFAVRILLGHPAFYNYLFILIQLGIGILILNRRTIKYGLDASVLWGLFVWYIGEGLGGLFGGNASLLMGAPGAALLYALIAIGVWPRKNSANQPASWLAIAWTAIWLTGAILHLQASQNTAVDFASTISGMAGGAPGWLASLDLHLGHWLGDQGNWIVLVAIAIQTLIGILIFAKKRWRALAIVAGIVVSLVFWIVGQSFGTIYSGLATDLNTAPLIILLGIAIFGSKEIDLNLT